MVSGIATCTRVRGVGWRRWDVRSRLWPVQVELAGIGAYLLAWQAAKAPFDAPRAGLAHTARWLEAEHRLGIAVERDVAIFARGHGLSDVALWCYDNLHLVALIAMLAAVRLVVPERYPWLRTTFVLVHLPVLVVAAVYPLAPPHAVPGLMPAGLAAAASESSGGLLSNTTSAAASIHFAWACCVAIGALLLSRRYPLAAVLALYPAWNLFVIVATGNHFVLDAAVGVGCLVLAAAVAALVHRGAPPVRAVRAGGARTARLVGGAALTAYGIEALSSTLPPTGPVVGTAAIAAGTVLLLLPRLAVQRVRSAP